MAAATAKPTVGGKSKTVVRKPSAPVVTKTALGFTPDAKKPDTKPDEPTKGALRFSETPVDDATIIGTVYIRKDEAIKRWGKLPTNIQVTVTPTFD